MNKNNGIAIILLYCWGCNDFNERIIELICQYLEDPNHFKAATIKFALKQRDFIVGNLLIAESQGRSDLFARDISRAHWSGNELLKPIKAADVERILSRGEIIGGLYLKWKSKIWDLVNKKPHHNTLCLQNLPKLKNNSIIPSRIIETTNNCLVLPGRIYEVNETLKVDTFFISADGKGFILQEIRKIMTRGFIKNPQKEEWVTIHLGIPREKISSQTARSLVEITKESIS